jgi:hypothetical protein
VISSLALLLNEFATNSVKYGALSATAGKFKFTALLVLEPSLLPGQNGADCRLPLPLAIQDSATFLFAQR